MKRLWVILCLLVFSNIGMLKAYQIDVYVSASEEDPAARAQKINTAINLLQTKLTPEELKIFPQPTGAPLHMTVIGKGVLSPKSMLTMLSGLFKIFPQKGGIVGEPTKLFFEGNTDNKDKSASYGKKIGVKVKLPASADELLQALGADDNWHMTTHVSTSGTWKCPSIFTNRLLESCKGLKMTSFLMRQKADGLTWDVRVTPKGVQCTLADKKNASTQQFTRPAFEYAVKSMGGQALPNAFDGLIGQIYLEAGAYVPPQNKLPQTNPISQNIV